MDRCDARDSCAPSPLGLRLALVGRAAASGLRRALEPIDLDVRQYRVLATVAALEGCPQRAVAWSLGIPPSRVVALLDDLEARSLVERVASPTDRRAHALQLTPAGRKVLASAERAVEHHERHLVAGLGDDDRARLVDLLGRLPLDDALPAGHGHGRRRAPEGG